jgi:uncharacterized protein (DUF885 family)
MYITITLVILLTIALSYALCLFFFRPWTIKGLFFRTFLKFSLQGPELLTTLGLLERLGHHRHNAKLNDASQEHEEKIHQFTQREYALLKSYNQATLSPQDRISARVMSYFLEDLIGTYAFKHHDYPVNQMFGVQSNLPNFMMTLHPLAHKSDVKNYSKRLQAFENRINQEILGLKLRQAKGVVPPRFTIDKVLEEMRAFIAANPEENPLYLTFAKRLKDKNAIPSELIHQEKTKVLDAISNSVYPAYARLIELLESFQKQTTTNHGVWALPEGEAYYKHCLKSNTTTDYTPEKIHDIGLKEVERIEAQMREILTKEGYAVHDTTPAKVLTQLAQEPQFKYPNTDEGREQCLEDYRTFILDIESKMDDYFYHKPKMALKIERIPEFKEKTAPGAYYMPGDLGGKRPGVFSVNLRDMTEIRKFEMKTLAYHEGVPGHHFQIALASEKKKMPIFRRILPFTAYAEGWAMYSELLAREMGMYEGDPFGLLGSLDSELFRAVRLVVDTGIHAKKWSREKAITYMCDHTASAYESVVSEIERYFVMPGQACAYKIGMIKVLELRDKYKSALGQRYDIKDFHEIVLSAGSIPLEVLEEIIDAAIASAKLM